MGRDELAFRVDRFSRGEWLTLLEEARGNMPNSRPGEVSLDVYNSVEGRQHNVVWSEVKCHGPDRS